MGGDPIRQLASEALGTGLLVATVVGSGIMAERLTDDVALQLLCNALPTGAILVVLVATFGPVSGAHFNPAVTLAFLIGREISGFRALAFAACQVAGGLSGTFLAHLMFGLPAFQASMTARTGGAAWLAEAVAAFGLVLVVLAGVRQRPEAVPWLVGLFIVAAYWFTSSTSFANPAVALARGFTDSFSGIRPADVPGFVAAELSGAAAAALFARWLFGGTANRHGAERTR